MDSGFFVVVAVIAISWAVVSYLRRVWRDDRPCVPARDHAPSLPQRPNLKSLDDPPKTNTYGELED